jgi:hypothetical protein
VTGLLRVKLRRDLREAWPQLLMMVSAMAVSLTVFGATLFAWSVCGRETTGAYASTEPASATLVLEPGVEAARMAALVDEVARRPGVLRAAGRAQFDSEVWVDGHVSRLGPELHLGAGVVGVARLRLEQLGHPAELSLDEVEAKPVLTAFREVVEDLDGRERVALAHPAPVALLQGGGLPGQVEVVDGASPGLQVDALVGDGVGHHHVVAGGSALLGRSVELLRDALPIGGRWRRLRVEHGDASLGDARLHQRLHDPAVSGHVVDEHDVAAGAVGQHPSRHRLELGRSRLDAGRRGRLPVMALVQVGVDRDKRQTCQQPQDAGLVRATRRL